MQLVSEAGWLGDYAEDYADLNFKFDTHDPAFNPISMGGSPVVSVYKADDGTESTAGVTLDDDFDSTPGLHNVNIDLSSDAFYETAKDYMVVLTGATISGIAVVAVIGHFSIENRFTG